MKNNAMELKKKHLNEYKKVKLSIKVLELTLSNFKDERENILNYKMVLNTDEFDKTVQKLSKLILDKDKLCLEIIEKIDLVNCEDEKNILLLKFINGCTLEEISEITNYSLRQVYYIYKKALKNFEI